MVIPSTGTVNLWTLYQDSCVRMQTTIWCHKASVTLRQLNMLVRHEYLRALPLLLFTSTWERRPSLSYRDIFRSLPTGDVWWRDTLSHAKGLCLHHCLHRNLWLAKQTSNSSNFKIVYLTYFDWCKVKTTNIHIQVCQETPTKVCAYRLRRSHPEGKAVTTVSPHNNNHTDQLFKCTYESRLAHNSIMNLSVSHASRQSHCQHSMLNSSELPCQQGSHRSSIMTPPAQNAVFTKIIGHFRRLVPNVWWEISQIWIE